LSEKAKREFRKANIGIGWGVFILLVGFIPLHGSDAAMQALAAGAFAVAMAVPFFLDWREEREQGSRKRRPD
jgi:hypothetical protein